MFSSLKNLQLLKRYTDWLINYPFSSRIITSGILLGTGDFIAQYYIEGKRFSSTKLKKIENEKNKEFQKNENLTFDFTRCRNAILVGVLFTSPITITWF